MIIDDDVEILHYPHMDEYMFTIHVDSGIYLTVIEVNTETGEVQYILIDDFNKNLDEYKGLVSLAYTEAEHPDLMPDIYVALAHKGE